MSKKLFILPALLGAFLLFATACGDSCDTTKCGNGTCLDGTCECDLGYEKDKDGNCTVATRDKFLGNYTVNETCSNSGTATPYPVGIIAGVNINEVKMNGVYGPVASGGFAKSVVATVSGNTLTIARQQPDGDNIYIVGSGTIVTTSTPVKINVSYTVTDETPGSPVVTNTCNTVTFTKN